MNDQRTAEVLRQILTDLADLNKGPGENVPVKTIWARAVQSGVSQSTDVSNAITLGVEEGFFTLAPGGIAGMGTITLTDAGYTASRS